MRSLDEFLPEFQFSERHRTAIAAPPAAIDQALRSVLPSEVPIARALFWLRGLHPRSDAPVLAGLAARGVVLDDVPGEGLILGLIGQFWRVRGGAAARPRDVEEFRAYSRPDVAKAVADFRVVPGGLATETRVHVPDPAARRQFARYWRVIRPFSGLTRILLLRAAKRRAKTAA